MDHKFIRETREKLGISQAKCAVDAECSITTWRTFEVAPDAVTPKKRIACERVLQILREKAQAA
jgi:hypothetical protein